jgi:MYXO-CTERM domain-containing protein
VPPDTVVIGMAGNSVASEPLDSSARLTNWTPPEVVSYDVRLQAENCGGRDTQQWTVRVAPPGGGSGGCGCAVGAGGGLVGGLWLGAGLGLLLALRQRRVSGTFRTRPRRRSCRR